MSTTVPVLTAGGAKSSSNTAELGAALAAQAIKPHLIHETVLNELARRRKGTHSTKTRSEVRGGGAKPWRQKGTGRARHGSTRSPQWTGGGVVFGPTPREHGGKVNRKIQLQGFLGALKAHVERDSVAVIADSLWDEPSTRKAAEFLGKAPKGLSGRPLLVVLDDVLSVTARSFRNLEGVYVLDAAELETVDIVAAKSLLVQQAAWDRLASRGSAPDEAAPAEQAPRKKAAPKRKAAEAEGSVEDTPADTANGAEEADA
ncbi:MAG: 50S ribosomal protein L4 [Thermoleophilia bacterium]|nr:50S ribosomal protein L4 [Thermoleophilia bacterium]